MPAMYKGVPVFGIKGCGEIYSTEAQMVGRWIDGKPLYRKTYTVNTPAAITTVTQKVATLPENATVVSVDGVVISKGGTAPMPAIYYDTNSFLCYVSSPFITNGEIRLQIGHANYANRPCIITIWYTKTTDHATIEVPAAPTSVSEESSAGDKDVIPSFYDEEI